MKYHRVIVRSRCFHFGIGETLREALRNWRKAGGRNRDGLRFDTFASDLPFAPHDREALEDEADAYVDGFGAVCWKRCERNANAVGA